MSGGGIHDEPEHVSPLDPMGPTDSIDKSAMGHEADDSLEAKESLRSLRQDQPTFGKFLHTHNPFYLISCFLVIYGLQGGVTGGGSEEVLAKSVRMTVGIAAYTLLIAVTCIGVVRLAKVWEDARSIFLVALLSMVALSTGFDELCISSSTIPLAFAILGLSFSVLVCEGLIGFCRLQLARSYRLSLYALLGVFFASPVGLGYAVRNRMDTLANSGSLLFSTACAFTLLLMIPALKRGPDSAAKNGTPWRWPWYPLTAFFILGLLAMIRSHALWMSFGFIGRGVTLEPLLLLPILTAVIIMIAETGLGQAAPHLTKTAMLSTPMLLLLGGSNHGKSHLPIHSDIEFWCGSSWTIAIATMGLVYAYLCFRRIKMAEVGVSAALFLAGIGAPLPVVARSVGMEPWMLVAFSACLFSMTVLRYRSHDWLWLMLASMVCAVVMAAGRSYALETESDWLAGGVAMISMLLIGRFFETELALFLRFLAAIGLVLGSGGAIFLSLSGARESWMILGAVLVGVAIALAYAFWVRRAGWFWVSAVQAAALFAALSWHSFQAGHLREVNWPISSGLACFGVGLVITTSKTGVFGRANSTMKAWDQKWQMNFRPGL